MKRLVLLVVGAVMACGCATTAKIPTQRIPEYSVTPAGLAEQTKANVTIEVEVLKPSEERGHPELFAFNLKQMGEAFGGADYFYPADASGRRWCYTFGFGDKLLTAMRVKLTNKTPHILRMKDSRIYLVVPGESPQAAVTALGNGAPQPVQVSEKKSIWVPKSYVEQDGSLLHWLTQFEREWDQGRKRGLISFDYPVGFAAQVVAQNRKAYQLINDLAVEILPDFSYEGILLFPVVVSFGEAKLMFYDITTKTDAAGNPVEKAAFEFPLQLEQVDLWYDKTEKIWKKGLPPAGQTTAK